MGLEFIERKQSFAGARNKTLICYGNSAVLSIKDNVLAGRIRERLPRIGKRVFTCRTRQGFLIL